MGAKNHVEVKIDYITSQGEKDKLTAAAEAQAGTGHDIMSHRDWNIRIHADVLEPLNDVADALVKQYGPISPVSEYLAKIKGVWRGIPTTVGSQIKPCCSTLPMMHNIIAITVLFSLIVTFANFDIVQIMTGGGPRNTPHVFATYAFMLGIRSGDLPLGAATSLFMFPILAIAAVFILRGVRKRGREIG